MTTPSGYYQFEWSGEEISALLAAVADSGLGGNAPRAPAGDDGLADADLITQTGFWFAVKNLLPSGGHQWSSILHIQRDSAAATQLLITTTSILLLAIRNLQPSGWTPWEWVNPPLQIGVEYRTVERYLGKPVYTKAIGLGALPNNSKKLVNHGVENMVYCLSLTGTVDNYNILGFNGVASIFCGITAISVETNSDQTSHEGIAVIRYTKSTD